MGQAEKKRPNYIWLVGLRVWAAQLAISEVDRICWLGAKLFFWGGGLSKAANIKTGLNLLKIGLQRELREKIFEWSSADITRPSVVRVSITNRCNYKCGYCNHWRQSAYESELDPAAWKIVFEKLKPISKNSVLQFSGGEPFLRADFFEIVQYARNAGFEWGVITNGYRLTDKVCDALCDLKPLNVDVSLDGISSESHDEARGVAKSHLSVRAGIAKLAEWRMRKGNDFRIRIKTTIHKLNYRRLPELVYALDEIGADTIDFSPMRVEGNRNREWLVPEQSAAAELEAIVNRLIAMKENGMRIETSIGKLRTVANQFWGERVEHGVANCKASLRDLHISPDGEARFCWSYDSLGNIFRSEFASIWSSTSSKAKRRQALNCDKHGTNYCATSCMAHRTFSENISRGLMHVRKAIL